MGTKDNERRKTRHAAVKVSKSVFFPLTKNKRGVGVGVGGVAGVVCL